MRAAVTFSSQGKMGSRSADIRRVDLSGGHPPGGGRRISAALEPKHAATADQSGDDTPHHQSQESRLPHLIFGRRTTRE